jgi:hypothetical protein
LEAGTLMQNEDYSRFRLRSAGPRLYGVGMMFF